MGASTAPDRIVTVDVYVYDVVTDSDATDRVLSALHQRGLEGDVLRIQRSDSTSD